MKFSKSLIMILVLVAVSTIVSVEAKKKGLIIKAGGKLVIQKGSNKGNGNGLGSGNGNNNNNNDSFKPNTCPVGIKTSCTLQIVPGCAGFKNGTYAYLTNGNRCTQCQKKDIVSFNENQKCPALTTPTPKPPTQNNPFVPNKCPVGIKTSCTLQVVPGCAGYKNGTYAYLANGNRCTQCSKDNIVSFNENQKCPSVSSKPPQSSFVPNKCPVGIKTSCTLQVIPGCAGYKNGTYAYLANGNRCTQCSKDNIVSFNENEKCPTK